MTKARILIVEDELIVQLDLQNRLERLGYAVAGVASKGEDAIAKALELGPDLILMDVSLEGSMNGIEAARQIGINRDIPVLYVTAYQQSNLKREEAELLHPALSKPFRTSELAAAIAEALQRNPG